MKTGDVWQSRSDGEDFILIVAMSRSRKSARGTACNRIGARRGGFVWNKRASTIKRDYQRYFSNDASGERSP